MDKKELTLEESKQIGLQILLFIDKVCKKHSISYSLDYGTLLGAIRHKGFIPWDDDIDIAMRREDYEIFMNIISEECKGSNYEILSAENTENYFYEFPKIVDRTTEVIEKGILRCNKMGVWVDIFPKDKFPKFYKPIKYILNILYVFRIFSVYKNFPNHHSILFYPIWLIGKITGYKIYNKAIMKLQKIGKNSKSGLRGYWLGFTAKRDAWDESMYDNYIDLDFEGHQFKGYANWDEYLTSLYGDYMKLPPIEKRRVHDYKAYRR